MLPPVWPSTSIVISTDALRSPDPEPVTIRVRVDFDDDFLDRDAGGLAAAYRFHRDEADGFELGQRSGQVWLRASRHGGQLRNGSRFAIADQGEQSPVVRCQQPDDGLNGVETRFARARRRR